MSGFSFLKTEVGCVLLKLSTVESSRAECFFLAWPADDQALAGNRVGTGAAWPRSPTVLGAAEMALPRGLRVFHFSNSEAHRFWCSFLR